MTTHFSTRFSANKTSSYPQSGSAGQKEDLKGFKGKPLKNKPSSLSKTRLENPEEGRKDFKGKPFYSKKSPFSKNRSEYSAHIPEGSNGSRSTTLPIRQPSFLKERSEDRNGLAKDSKDKPLFSQKPSFAKIFSEEQNNFSKEGKRKSFQPKKSSFAKARLEEQDDLLKSSKGKPLPKRAKDLKSWKRQDFFLKDEEIIDLGDEGICNASF